jgi:ABC-2 type transport system permease protein
VGIATSLVQPLLFLFVLGVGLDPLVGDTGGLGFQQYLFPGVLALSAMTAAVMGAVSIVLDRKLGFMRELAVSPVSPASIIVGKTLGGATVATLQTGLLLPFAPLVGLSLPPLAALEVAGLVFLLAFAVASLGAFVASGIRRIEDFQTLSQFLLLPLVLLSGTLFPVQRLPPWLGAAARLDPFTYPVDAIRRVLLSWQSLPDGALQRYGADIEVLGHRMGLAQEAGLTVAFALLFVALAAIRLRRSAAS